MGEMKHKVFAILLVLTLLCAVVPLTAAASESLQVTPTVATLSVNGKTASYNAYIIRGTHYTLPSELAALLRGTEKQFDIGYDKTGSIVSITTGKAYTVGTNKSAAQADDVRMATPKTATLQLDGMTVSVHGYTIDGNLYLKLRDLAQRIDFSAVWDAAGKIVLLDTTEGYMATSYANAYFDFTNEIDALNAKSPSFTSPAAADIGITVMDEQGATGVVLVAASDSNSQSDYYLNVLVAGNKLIFQGEDIKSVSDQVGTTVTDITVSDGRFTLTPLPINADKPVDEIITITKTDNSVYKIHTVNEYMPGMDVMIGSEKSQTGVYTFLVDDFLLRVSTDGNIVYYRNMALPGGNISENFTAQDTADGRFYTYMLELNTKMRGMGFASGMYVIMDQNYHEINYVTLTANDDKNHTHGEGYLDEHEFVLLGKDHWINLSYTPVLVDNLKTGGLNNETTAYVQAGIIQEVRNGKVIYEYNTTDYPCLYDAAMETAKYSESSNVKTPNDYMDYAHVNSVYIDPKDDNLLVSLRSQYAIYKINRTTGDLMWALGGTLNSFSGLDDYKDADGNLLVGQHYARYLGSDIAGDNNTVTVFDNHTSYEGNTTRMLTITLDENAKTATASVINGSDLDKLTAKKHWSTHCGVYEIQAKGSAFMGWGSNVILDMKAETVSSHALLTDYDTVKNVITFELNVERNSHYLSSPQPCFSYRAYKNVT